MEARIVLCYCSGCRGPFPCSRRVVLQRFSSYLMDCCCTGLRAIELVFMLKTLHNRMKSRVFFTACSNNDESKMPRHVFND